MGQYREGFMKKKIYITLITILIMVAALLPMILKKGTKNSDDIAVENITYSSEIRFTEDSQEEIPIQWYIFDDKKAKTKLQVQLTSGEVVFATYSSVSNSGKEIGIKEIEDYVEKNEVSEIKRETIDSSGEFVIDIDKYGLEKGKYYFIITGTADARGSVKFTFYDE